jgi:hypothetical protein
MKVEMRKWCFIFFFFGISSLFGNYIETIFKSQGVLSPEDLRHFKDQFNLHSFIETGTYAGDTTAVAAETFSEVFSIEISDSMYKAAQKRFASYPNIHLYLGDTTFLLKRMIADSSPGKRLYWLDAHCSGGGTGGVPGFCPIPYELDQIFSCGDFDSVILIDDLRGLYHCDERTNLPLRELIRIIKKANPDLVFYSIGDVGIVFNEKSYPSISVSQLVKAASFSRFFDPQCEDESILEQLIDAELFIGSFKEDTREGKNFRKLVKFVDFHEGVGGEVIYLLWASLYELGEGDTQSAIRDLQIVAGSVHAHWRIDAYLVKALILAGRVEEARSLFNKKLILIDKNFPKILRKIFLDNYQLLI